MNILLEKSILEMKEEIKLQSSPDENEEAQRNMWSQYISDEFSFEDIEEYLTRCKGIYWAKNLNGPKIFYAWYDEMAGQLRISAVSVKDVSLSFKCNIQFVELTDFINATLAKASGLYKTPNALNVWQERI